MGDLKNRTRICIVVENNVLEWLKSESKKTYIPNSRIIEKALIKAYGKEIEEFIKSKNKEDKNS